MMNLTTPDFADKALLQQINTHLPDILSVVLLTALAYNLGVLTWEFYQQDDEVAVTPVAEISPVRSPVSKNRVRDITNSYLYGKAQQKAAAPTQAEAPVSKLNLKLRGVLAATPSSLATAIIETGKGKEEIYAIGDTIQRGVKLEEINEDHIIVDRQGSFEKILMEKSTGSEIILEKQASRTRLPMAKTGQESLKSIRDSIRENPISFGDYALPVIVRQDGKQIGYRLKPQARGDFLAKLGLQPSDIITEINGNKLDNPANGIRALRSASTADSLNLMVKRGNSVVPMNIQLQ